MRNKLKLLMFLLVGLQSFAINYEVKVGVAPYESYGNNGDWFDFKNGLDYGLDIYQTYENGYSIGVGAEIKRKIKDIYTSQDERLYAYYLIGKKELWNNYSLVSRIGRTSQNEFESEYYVGAGIEKRIENVNLQLMYEATKLKSDIIDEDYGMLSFKVGYIFGDGIKKIGTMLPTKFEENKKIVPAVIVPVAPVEEYVMDKLDFLNMTATSNYEAYVTELTEKQKNNIKLLAKELERIGKPGRLEIRGLTDSSGTKQLNKGLGIERSEKVMNYLREIIKLDYIDFIIIRENVGAVDYIYDNSTYENRKKNRRVEVKFNETK